MRTQNRTWYILLLLVLTPLVATLPGIRVLLSNNGIPGWDGDAYGHLFKIWKLYRSGWRPWIEDWYSGYPFLRFYPPLAYLISASIARLMGDPFIAYKIVIIIIPILSSISMYALARIINYSRKAALISAIAYATSPWLYRIIAPEANFPRALGYALAPLETMSLIILLRSNRLAMVIISALLFSLIILTHHSLAFVILPASLIIALVVQNPSTKYLKAALRKIIIFTIVVTSITSFWIIPFLADHEMAHFIPETRGYLYRLGSVEPLSLISWSPHGWGYYQGAVRIIISLSAIVLALVLKMNRTYVLVLALLLAIFSLLSLGLYGPTPWLNKLPVLDHIPPYRWLDSFQLVLALITGFFIEEVTSITRCTGSKRCRKLVILISIVIVVLLVLESMPQLRYWKAQPFDRDLAHALRFINEDTSTGWRFYQWGMAETKGSMIAFSPSLAHKPCIDGWYRQGDPLYIMHGELGWALTHDPRYAERLLYDFAIKYVIIDLGLSASANAKEILEKIGFHEVFRSGNIRVYSWNNASLVKAVKQSILIISCSPGIVERLLGAGLTKGGCYLDNHSFKELAKYRLVILYDYRYSDPESWKTFIDYVEKGGVLVIDTYRSPDMEGPLPIEPRIFSHIEKLHGDIRLVDDTGRYYYIHLDYMGGPWVSTIYTGEAKPILRYNNYTVIGETRLGRGKIYLVGLNLFYHTYLYGEKWEKRILQDIVQQCPSTTIRLNLVEWSDGRILFNYSSGTEVVVKIAEAWFPHWEIYLDNKSYGKPDRDRIGLMEILLPPGNHIVLLEFKDSFRSLGMVSAFSLIILSVIVFYDIMGKRQKRR